MKRMIAAAAVLLALGGSAFAQQRGYVTTDVNLRAGPGTAYPVVVILEGGTPLGINGCIDGYSWCDVDWRGNRGWVAAQYLDYEYRGRRVDFYDYAPTVGVPIVTFRFDDYWGRYYRGRSWYSNYDRWGPPPPRGYRPPPPGPGWGPPPGGPGWGGPPPGGPGWNNGRPPGGNWGGPPPGGGPGWNNGGRPPQQGGNWGNPPPGGGPGWNNGGRPPQQGGNWGNPPPGGGQGRPPQGQPPQQGQRPPQGQPPQQPPQQAGPNYMPQQYGRPLPTQQPGMTREQTQQQRCQVQPNLPGCPRN